jgi:hypothetical protein
MAALQRNSLCNRSKKAIVGLSKRRKSFTRKTRRVHPPPEQVCILGGDISSQISSPFFYPNHRLPHLPLHTGELFLYLLQCVDPTSPMQKPHSGIVAMSVARGQIGSMYPSTKRNDLQI